ncbi:bifunctional nuclease family protein [Candidatus Latescibacterota bacterium]
MAKKPRHDHLLPVKVWRIYPYPDVTPPETFLVVLKGDEDKFVPISIGFPEGQYLVMAMQQVSFPRPLTHNLIQNLIEKVKGQVHQLVIHTLKDETFHAYLLIQTEDEVFYLDCRPSDGMILATLMSIPIYMSPEVMTAAGRELSGMLNIADLGEDSPTDGETPSPTGEEALVEVEIKAEEEEEAGEVEIEVQVEGVEPSELDLLRAQLDRLVAEEAYEEAARVRDLISELEESETTSD